MKPVSAISTAHGAGAREGERRVSARLAVTARGIAQAVEILSQKFILVATNVPYLSGRKQANALADYIASKYPHAQSDLAAAFLEASVVSVARVAPLQS